MLRAQGSQGPGVPCGGAHAHQDLAQGYFNFQGAESGEGTGPARFVGTAYRDARAQRVTGHGFSTIARELDTRRWIQVCRQPHARASSARDEPELSIPFGKIRRREPDSVRPKTKRAGTGVVPFPTLLNTL